MGFYGCIPRFIKNHGSLILTVLSGLGLVGTVVVTAKQAPKANLARAERLEEKINEATDALMQASVLPEGVDRNPMDIRYWCRWNTELTLGEKVKAMGPYYLPVILLGLGTLGCMAGAQILNTKQQAALIGAYALLQKDFGAYRQEIRDTYGEEADRKALAESRKKVDLLEAEVKRLEEIKNVQTFGISTLPGVIFRSDMANIERAFLHFNRNLILRGWADLPELYEFLGLSEEMWKFIDKAPDEDYGWNAYENEVSFGCSFMDYRLLKVKAQDGTEAFMIDFDIPPYRIEGADYRTEDPGVFYEGYKPEDAKQMMKRGMQHIPVLIDSVTHTVEAPGCFVA